MTSKRARFSRLARLPALLRNGQRTIFAIKFRATRDEVFKAFPAIANLADKSDEGKLTIQIEASNAAGYDPTWLRNAVEEPLDEAASRGDRSRAKLRNPVSASKHSEKSMTTDAFPDDDDRGARVSCEMCVFGITNFSESIFTTNGASRGTHLSRHRFNPTKLAKRYSSGVKPNFAISYL